MFAGVAWIPRIFCAALVMRFVVPTYRVLFNFFQREPAMLRIALFVATNLAVMVVLGVVSRLFGIDSYLGTSTTSLMIYALVVGFAGSTISLLMSKTMAKRSMGVHVIEQPGSAEEQWLVDTVRRLADGAGIGMPEVGIYDGAPNAFATGARRDASLVAVSTGLLNGMTREEVEAVLGHEISHVANGDMVTMTLIQGVMNTFVVFLSRAIGSVVDSAMRGQRGQNEEEEHHSVGMGYYLTSMVLDVLLGFLAGMVVAWFSRWREFRADAGAARLMGQPQSMVRALQRLGAMQSGALPQGMKAMGIAGDIGKLFASHPPLEERIAALQAAQAGVQ